MAPLNTALLSAGLSAPQEMRIDLHHLEFLARDRGDLVDYEQFIFFKRNIASLVRVFHTVTALGEPPSRHRACSTMDVPPATDGIVPCDHGQTLTLAGSISTVSPTSQ